MKRISILDRALLVLATLALLPGMAAACCTAIICPYCVSSSDNCVCGSETPVCNAFGCNCNNECGAFAAGTDLKCYASISCDSDAKARFDEVDGDKNGTISKDEAWVWARKQKNPLNLSKSDLPEILLAAEPKPQEVMSAAFDKADTDANGTISPAEFDSSLGKPAN
jgi:hypothetical protein